MWQHRLESNLDLWPQVQLLIMFLKPVDNRCLYLCCRQRPCAVLSKCLLRSYKNDSVENCGCLIFSAHLFVCTMRTVPESECRLFQLYKLRFGDCLLQVGFYLVFHIICMSLMTSFLSMFGSSSVKTSTYKMHFQLPFSFFSTLINRFCSFS